MSSHAAWLARHVKLMRASYLRTTERFLLDPDTPDEEAVAFLKSAPYALVSHDTQADPVFNYANDTALALFQMDWDTLTRLPSRYSAEPDHREDRARLLAQVSEHGYIDDYAGIRIASTGQRFRIHRATVWNLWDEDGKPYGQAALIPSWEMLSD